MKFTKFDKQLMLKLFPIVSVIVLLVMIATLVYLLMSNKQKIQSYQIGLDAVNYLYNFSSLEELDRNMDKLKQITTPEVYSQLTVDNTSRALSVYLKFKGKPSLVEVDDFTTDQVSYHLKTETIASSRKFIFLYRTNSDGLIDKVREVEAIDFISGN